MANKLHYTVGDLAGKVTVRDVEEWLVFAELAVWEQRIKANAMTGADRAAAITAGFMGLGG